ncbi:MAG: bifunctional diguanylate cyclase/phosphodiesterase [Gammaproteobacteria bacterium]|nr:bifunctional diguanylate cyclase/phosphodiesterase [Gammaproteobacteria bacterium]
MRDNNFYSYLHKQIPVLTLLSLLPGLGYIFLGWLHDSYQPALVWYSLIVLVSLFGIRLYSTFNLQQMTEAELKLWHKKTFIFFYVFFLLWTVIFVTYVNYKEYNLHYIAVFTQIGASVVAAAILYPDQRLYRSAIYTLMLPLIIYFIIYDEWVGYVLAAFSATLTWVLLYSASATNSLLSKLSFQANHDFLTAMFNRQYFINALQKKMNALTADGKYSYLLLIDLDHFKTINDSLGHDIGDGLLQVVAERLQHSLEKDSIVARLGGDEFIICGPYFNNKDECKSQALAISDNILLALKQAYKINRHHVYISCSIGASLISASSSNAVEFIKEADIAMYEVKAQGRDGVFFFDEEMSAKVEHNLRIEQLLHQALIDKEINVYYQPQLDLHQRIVGSEALARWRNDELGEISPAEFIPIAEQTGLIIELGNYILEQAICKLAEWQDAGIELHQFSINISMRQLMHTDFVNYVSTLCKRHLKPDLTEKLVFELTESVIAENPDKISDIMNDLKELGIKFSMDDFGTGYSSLSYIRQLPIEEIKIDRSFIRDIGQDMNAQQMIVTILEMARIFKLRVVAEGVETEQQLAFLRQHNCHLVQGYFFSFPVNSDEFIELYRQSPLSGNTNQII